MEVTSAKKLEGSRAKALLESREVELKAALLQARERYVADSPEVTQLERFLADTRNQLSQEGPFITIGEDRIVNPVYTDLRQRLGAVLAQLASAKASLAEKQGPLALLEERLHQIPGLVKQITEMNRARESLELRHKLLRERLMMADVSRTTVGTIAQSVHVIDLAHPSMKPTWPRNIVLVPAALAMGLLVGCVVAVLRELLSSKVNRDRIASRRDMPIYAVIGLRGTDRPLWSESFSGDNRPIAERLRLMS
jgi:tyrosine-protein kinase Etk/Wzc